MIKGAPQVVEFEAAASPLRYITTDADGRQRKPDALPTIEILDADGEQLLAPATVAADFDFDVDGGLTNLDTIIEATSPGTWANAWTVQVAAAVAAGITIDRTNKTILIEFITTVTTVTDIETLIGALVGEEAVIEVGTAGTGANVLTTAGDTMAATALAGGVGLAMEAKIAKTEGFLDYDTQTAEYGLGEVATGAAGATGRIVGDDRDGTSGTLRLSNVDGTYVDGEALTDSDSGSGKVNGVLWSAEHVYWLDASDDDTYPIAQGYRAEIVYEIDGIRYERQIWFDVSWYPMAYPLVSTQDVDEEHPTWIARRPSEWKDWTPAIKSGHANLVRRIHAMEEQASDFVKRESEMWRLTMAFVEERIAISCGFPKEEKDEWKANREAVWRTKGYLTKSAEDDGEDAEVTSLGAEFER